MQPLSIYESITAFSAASSFMMDASSSPKNQKIHNIWELHPLKSTFSIVASSQRDEDVFD